MIGHTVGDLDLLSIVSPVYNEERHIDEFIDRCLAVARRCPVGQFEIVLVDDGSQDRSRDRILSKAADHPDSSRPTTPVYQVHGATLLSPLTQIFKIRPRQSSA